MEVNDYRELIWLFIKPEDGSPCAKCVLLLALSRV
jgi:hypothetical protein